MEHSLKNIYTIACCKFMFILKITFKIFFKKQLYTLFTLIDSFISYIKILK